jgi:hypothetical protein
VLRHFGEYRRFGGEEVELNSSSEDETEYGNTTNAVVSQVCGRRPSTELPLTPYNIERRDDNISKCRNFVVCGQWHPSDALSAKTPRSSAGPVGHRGHLQGVVQKMLRIHHSCCGKSMRRESYTLPHKGWSFYTRRSGGKETAPRVPYENVMAPRTKGAKAAMEVLQIRRRVFRASTRPPRISAVDSITVAKLYIWQWLAFSTSRHGQLLQRPMARLPLRPQQKRIIDYSRGLRNSACSGLLAAF